MKVKEYEVGRLIGESSKFRIYLGNSDAEQVVLKVAKTFEDGDALAAEASKFNLYRAFIDETIRYQELLGEKSARFDLLFASLEDSFLEPDQDDRRINVLSVTETDFDHLIPLAKLYAMTKIDARTGVWILGRLFKIYSFFELMATQGDNPVVQYPDFSAGDYLIDPRRHRLIYYNFSGEGGELSAHKHVRKIAQFMRKWIETKKTWDEDSRVFRNWLCKLGDYGADTFEKAHRELYEKAQTLWGIGYYPFTYCDLEAYTWKTIEEG